MPLVGVAGIFRRRWCRLVGANLVQVWESVK